MKREACDPKGGRPKSEAEGGEMLKLDLRFFGGRGASSGMSAKGKPYGSEYKTLLTDGNVKFVRYNGSQSAKTPMETMTKNRVYVTVNSRDIPTSITYYDKNNKRRKTIDLTRPHHGIQPHTHEGYEHAESGTRQLDVEEKSMVDRVLKTWHNRTGK